MENIRRDVADSISFASYTQKLHFDKKHNALPNFKVGDWVRIKYVKKGDPRYHSEAPLKLGPVYSSPYQIIRKVSPWAYELQLPEGDKTHPVVSIAHLRGMSANTIMSKTPAKLELQPTDGVGEVLYEVEAIVGKRFAGKGRKSIEYKVKWRNVDKAEWEPIENLNGCTDAIEEYEGSLKNSVVVYSKDKLGK